MNPETPQLVPVVIGPEGRGRGYAILASGGTVAPGSWTVDLPMLLLEWAKLGSEEPFAACLPLDGDAAVVCRGRYFRQLEIGPVAYLHAIHLDASQLQAIGWQTEAVLEAIPVPAAEDTAFAEMPISVSVGQRKERGTDPLGVAWEDTFVSVDPTHPLDALLVWGLQGLAPTHLRQRVQGWSTSAALPARGSLNPNRHCQLFVVRGLPEGEHVRLRHVPIGEDGIVPGPRPKDPPAYQAWAAFHRLKALDGSPPHTEWRGSYAADSAVEMTARLARIAAGATSASAMLALLRELLASDDPAQNEAARQVLPRYLEAASNNGEVAEPLVSFFESALPGEREFMPNVIEALSAKPLSTLDSQLLARILPGSIALAGDAAAPGTLAAIARIATHAAQVTQSGNKVIDMLVRLLETWPVESRNLLDELAQARFLEVLGGHGGNSMVERAMRSLFATRRELLERSSSNRDSCLRVLLAQLTAYKRLQASYG